jgi:phospholipase/lecithinase/hemolysin
MTILEGAHLKRTRLVLLVLLACATAPLFAGSTSAPPAFMAFGDSLADTGNDRVLTRLIGQNPAIPPSDSPHRSYYNGRFSNGPVAFEYLWSQLTGRPIGSVGSLRPFLAFPLLGKYDAASFAFGGSRSGFYQPVPGSTTLVPGFRAQVQLYGLALVGKPVPRTLYAVVTGANDYLVLPPEHPANPAVVVKNIADGIRDLYKLGARDVVVVNLPDLGLIPLVIGDPVASAGLSGLSQLHNLLLADALAALEVQLSGLNVIEVDINAVIQQLPATTNRVVPALDVLVGPGASVCLFTDPSTCQNTPTFSVGLDFLFWDAEHPTTAAHRRLAEHIYGLMGS